jgi:hypothetical protein
MNTESSIIDTLNFQSFFKNLTGGLNNNPNLLQTFSSTSMEKPFKKNNNLTGGFMVELLLPLVIKYTVIIVILYFVYKYVTNFLSKGIAGVFGGIGKTGKVLSEGSKIATKAAFKGAKEASKTVSKVLKSKTAKKVGKTVSKGAEKAGKTISKALKSKDAKKAKKAISKAAKKLKFW